MQSAELTSDFFHYIIILRKSLYERSIFMEFLPGAVQVLIDWLIMIVGTLGTFFKKMQED